MLLVFIFHGGLSNRIRSLLAHYHVCQYRKKKLYVYWQKDPACPDHFSEIFHPLPDLEFVKKSYLRNHHIDFEGDRGITLCARHYKVPINATKALNLYRLLQPLPHLEKEIAHFREKHTMDHWIGLHLRRTDHLKGAMRKYHVTTPDEEFIQFMKRKIQSNSQQKFYLATDNQGTQQFFKTMFPSHVFFYQTIHRNEKSRKRNTDLAHSVIDLYLLASCQFIKGTQGSTFTLFATKLWKIQQLVKESETDSIPKQEITCENTSPLSDTLII